MAPTYCHDSTHAYVPGAWWWNHREMPFLRQTRGGTYVVTTGFVNLGGDDELNGKYRRNFGAVVDDYGNLVPVQEGIR